jgi:hypothetical protein
MIPPKRLRSKVLSLTTASILSVVAPSAVRARGAATADTETSEHAEDTNSGDSGPEGGAAETPVAPKESRGAHVDSSVDSSKEGFVVERLPPTAYPEWRTRGISGGSLSLDASFHGMQWPYFPKTGIGLSGSVWADNSYQKITREAQFPQTEYWVHQSRAVLRVTPTFSSSDDFFVQGQVETVGNYNQLVQRSDAPDTDDLWVRFGKWNSWDIQVGRYEAYALHHFGMGLDLNTVERQGALDENSRAPVDFNYATTLFYRPNGTGNIALHLHFWEADKGLPAIRVELLTQYGYDSFDRIGVRPALIADFGVIKVKVGTEHRWTRPRDTQVQTIMTPRVDAQGAPVIDPTTGSQFVDISYQGTRKEKFYDRCLAAGTVQLVLFPWMEAGVQGAYCLSDHTTGMGGTDIDGSYTQWTVGGFANFSPLTDVVVGGGADLADWTNLHKNDLGQFGHQTNLAAFGAVQYLVHKQLYVKLVGAYDKAKRENLEGGTTQVTTTMVSARLRLMYLF